MAELKRVLVARGVKIREHCGAKSLVRDNMQFRAVTTSDGAVEADSVLIAAGALAPQWSRDLGCRLPIQPGKGCSITMPRPCAMPRGANDS